ncbi:hypothetical protein GCM10028772_20750 [Nocardioides ultimimeridianus]
MVRLVCVAAIGASLAVASVGDAHASVLAAPGGLTATGSNPPVLSWSPVPGAVRYEVQADTEDGFSTPPVKQTTVATTYVPTALLSAGDYFWHVRAIDADNIDSDWASGTNFTISPVGAPTGLSPDGGATPSDATLQQPGQPVTLSWQPVAGAKSYTIEVAHDQGFAGSKTYSTQAPSLVVPDALQPQDYYWHVKALLDTGIESAFSTSASFVVGSLASPDNLRVIGDDGATIADPQDVQDVILAWDPVAGAKTYDLQVSTDDTFPASSLVDTKTGLLSSRYSPTTTYPNSAYFWRVRAVDLSGNPTGWTTTSFVRKWLTAPTVVEPAPSADPANVSDPLVLQWTPVRHASHYEIEMGPDRNFSPGTYNSCRVAGTTYTPSQFTINVSSAQTSIPADDRCTPVPGNVTYWQVRPLDRPYSSVNNDGVAGQWSDLQSLVYDPDLQRLTGVTPADGASIDVPTLAWSPARGAETYAITVKKGTAIVATATTHSTSYVVQPSAPLTAGTYTWSITAKDAAGRVVSMTETRSFDLSGTIPAGSGAPLTAQTGTAADPASAHAPLLSWTPLSVGGAQVTYQIDAKAHGATGWIAPSSTPAGNIIEKSLVYPAVTDPSTLFSAPGTYDWVVSAWANGELQATSAINTFQISSLSVPGATQRIALTGADVDAGHTCAAPVTASLPACATVPSTPVVDWDPVPGASFYIVYVAKDAGFTNLVETATAMPATASTRWAPTFAQAKSALPDSKVGESYFVHIRACASVSSCGLDPVSTTGNATMQFRKSSPAVVLQTPADGTTVNSPVVSLDWQDYRDTNAATSWSGVAGAAAPDQSAMQYRVQVATDSSFGTPLETAVVDQSTYTSPSRLYPQGKYYWRVQAIDVESNDLTWSPTYSFTKSTTAPQLLAPLDGTTVGETPALSWQPQAFAAGYRVEIYRNGDTALSSGNLVTAANLTVKQTSYVYDKPLPPGGSPYLWRVRTVDQSGNTGPWTSVTNPGTSFTVAGATPTLTSPAAGATVPANQLVLRWSPVPGAVSYQVEVQKAAGSTAIDTAATRATAYAPSPTQQLAAGSDNWRVIAKDSNNNELGHSAWRGVVVTASNPPLQASVAPSISGNPVVGATLTANPGTWLANSPRFTYQWLRNGQPISGAVGSVHQVAYADAVTSISVRVTASKTGWADGTASSAPLSIRKAPTTTSLTASPTRLRQGTRATAFVNVSVPGSPTSATGSIRIYDRLGTGTPRLIRTVTLGASAHGHLNVSVTIKGVGTHRLRATYVGSTRNAASSSPWVKVVATRT